MANILVVEDEHHMLIGLKDNLEFEGYAVDTADDGLKGLSLMTTKNYDLVLLDVMMPGMSGLDVCKKARNQGVKTPIIFLTAKGEEIDKVLGLELGADDYITKPFSLRELLARVKAVLRRSDSAQPSDMSSIQLGRLLIDFQHYEAKEEGAAVKMTHKEFDTLKFLLQHKNEVVSRYQLLEEVWGYESQPTTRTIDNFILKLRQKIETTPNEPQHIITAHGVGYKLIV
jgi:DNA-binding response OmpR family regulator